MAEDYDCGRRTGHEAEELALNGVGRARAPDRRATQALMKLRASKETGKLKEYLNEEAGQNKVGT